MSLTHIRSAVDHEQPLLGDVVIIKRTYVDPKATPGKQLQTLCTDCGQLFTTSFRRMGRLGSRRACEVRNVPQCSPCRSKYAEARKAAKSILAATFEGAAAAAAAAAAPRAFAPGDRVRCIEGGNFIGDRALVEGQVYTVSDVDGLLGLQFVSLVERPEVALGTRASRFVLARAPGEFRAGDTVRVVDADRYMRGNGLSNGTECVVRQAGDPEGKLGTPGPYLFIQGKVFDAGHLPSRFELV